VNGLLRRSGAAALAVAALGWMLGSVRAEGPRYRRDVKIKVQVKKTAATQPLSEKPKAGRKEARPEITADEFINIQGKVQHIRGEQIAEFRRLIEDTDPGDPELPDLLFRLAELYAQQQRYWRFRAMEMHTKIDKAPRGQRAGLKAKQDQYFKEERKFLLDAIKVYKAIAENRKFRRYKRMDEALFFYAFTLQSAKYVDQSRTVFQKLIQDYPNSRYVPAAYLSFADYFFEQNDLVKAEKFYDKVLEFPKSSVYAYALYKKGWVYLNQARHQDALETFLQVAQKTERDKDKKVLNKAAKKDFVRAYAEIGKVQKAYQSFQRVDQDYAFNMLQILADLYLEQGKAEKAIYVYRELIGIEPKNKQVCEWQYNIVRGVLTIGNQSQQAEEIEKLVRLYAAYSSKKLLSGSYLDECRENAHATTSEMAKLWHNEAIKTLNPETLVYVERLYKLYMDHFSDAEDYGEMQYYYAELLWSRAENEKNERLATEMWEKAAVAFTDVVKSGKVNDKMRKESAYAAVLGWKNALAVDPATRAPPPADDKSNDKVPEPQPIPEREQKMIAAFDIYIEYVKDPKDEELVMMKFLKARICWRYNQFDKALPLFKNIIEKHIEHETAEYSANLLLDSLNRLQRYSEMLEVADILLEKKAFLEGKDDLVARLKLIKSQSLRKAAEELEKGKKYVECGQAYLDIFNQNPDGQGMDEVLYNAGVCFESGKSIGLAIYNYEQLSKRFPKSPHTQKALVRLGDNYAAIAYYDRAAGKYEEYARKYGGEKEASGALSNAFFYRKGIGQDDKAIEDAEFFIKQYGSNKKLRASAADAAWSIHAIYEKRKDDEKLIKYLERYVDEWGKDGGRDRELIAGAKIGKLLWEQSCPVKNPDGSCVKVKRERSIVDKRKKKKRNKGSELPTQCGPESKVKVQVVSRDERLAKRARKFFQEAVDLWEKKKVQQQIPGESEGDKAIRLAMATYWYAAAKFYLAEDEYEAYLGLKFPTKLDFDPNRPKVKERSEKAFVEWMKQKEKLGGGAAKKYVFIKENIKGGGAHWAIAAAARVGQIAQNYSDALFTVEIPKDVRSGEFAEDKVDAYCDTLMNAAYPLEDKSVQAFGFCLDVSTELNWSNEWSKLCEHELGQIRPQDFPTASELHARPDAVAAVLDKQGVVEQLSK
jgi:tetratricopeptide (TPR) repeat protein